VPTASVARGGVRLDGVSRSVEGEIHLSEISLAFAPGSFNVLLGRTRAGKTSLLRLLAGLDRPDHGKLYADGKDVTRTSVRQRDVAMVYQQFVNYPSLTVYENIASPLRVRRSLARDELDRRVREAAQLLGLVPLLQRLPGELSGGQQQRCALARALVKDASLVLLDEPLANLDYKLREELRVQLRALFAERGATVVYATSEPDEALLLSGDTVVLDEGRVLQFGPALEVYERPNSERVAQVFSDPQLNLLELEVAADGSGRVGAETSFKGLKGLSAGRYRIGVRADHLRLEAQSNDDLHLRARVLVDEVTGSTTLLHVEFGQSSLTAQLPGIHRRALGSPLDLFVAPQRLFVFHLDGRLALPASDVAHGTH
jgi:glycerol transport system ATP-binding protein